MGAGVTGGNSYARSKAAGQCIAADRHVPQIQGLVGFRTCAVGRCAAVSAFAIAGPTVPAASSGSGRAGR
jgi:hypothetical protein